ncbi:MAG: GNAT family N-acetyltransferase [bacterium]
MRFSALVLSHVLRMAGVVVEAIGVVLFVEWLIDSALEPALLVSAVAAITLGAVALVGGGMLARWSSPRAPKVRLPSVRMPPSDIDIVEFRPEHAPAFYTLNRAWLDEHALYEPADEAQLADPEREILAPGGAIYIAVRGDDVVGTAAVVPHGPNEVELVKLTVSEAARGGGVGRRLVERCIEFARHTSATRIVLVSSTKLGAALTLYESLGFTHRPLPAVMPYKTADVFMTFDLAGERSESTDLHLNPFLS